MGKLGKKSFFELVQENKQELLKDPKALEKIEDRLEERHMKRA